MKAIATLALTLVLGLSAVGCSDNPTKPVNDKKQPPRLLTATEKQVAATASDFGLRLFRQVAASEPTDKNVFIGPLSVAMALGMTCNGANGATLEAMKRTLGLQGMSLEEMNRSFRGLTDLLYGLDSSVTFEIANSIWCRAGFTVKPEFFDVNRTYFDARTETLDFSAPSAADIINGWVNEKTRGKISEIVDNPIDPLTMMFVINAIYFLGDWTYQFDPDATHQDVFYRPDHSPSPCLMMTQKAEFSYFRTQSIQAIDLPYGNGSSSMAIILPRSGDLSGAVDMLIDSLDADTWSRWRGQFSHQEVELYMPKFRLEYETSLKSALAALGMDVAFVPFEADFSNIAEVKDLHISEVKHKAFVRVDEKGTEAAAVTSVEIGVTAINPDEFVMRIDRPFVFFIWDHHSGTILFAGKIVEPGIPG